MRSAEGRPELRKEEAVDCGILLLEAGDPRVGREPDEPLELVDNEGRRRVGTRRPIEGGAPMGKREYIQYSCLLDLFRKWPSWLI